MKPQPYRNPKLLALAKDAPCAICGSYGTTVAAHANWAWAGKGMGRKADDSFVAFLCYKHHSAIDQGQGTYLEKESDWLIAMAKTYHYLLSNNLLIINPLPNNHQEFQ